MTLVTQKLKQLRNHLGVLVALLSMTGCVGFDRAMTKVTDFRSHHSYSYSHAVDGGVLIAGVSNKYKSYSTESSLNAAGQFAQVLSKSREEYTVAPGNVVISKLNSGEYITMLNQYNEERWIDEQWLEQIRQNTPHRYIVFGRLEEDIAKRGTHPSVNEDWRKYRKGPKYTISKDVSRRTTASFDVFDLAQDIIVWSGTIEKFSSNNTSYQSNYSHHESTHSVDPYNDRYEKVDKDDLSLTQMLGRSWNGNWRDYPYPPIPSLSEMYYLLFDGFSAHTPHEKD